MDTIPIDFDLGRRISIELGTQLLCVVEGVDYNFKSNLIGMDSDKFLIIRAPVTTPFGNISHKFFKGNKMIVRYLHKGTVFGFQTELIEDMFVPLKLLFLKYPKIVEEQNLRSAERVNCFLPVIIEFKSNLTYVEGVMLDVSEKGCCCVYKKATEGKRLSPIDVGELITIRCQFPYTEAEQIIPGAVRDIKSDGEKISLGIMFHGIDLQEREIINQYITAVQGLIKSNNRGD